MRKYGGYNALAGLLFVGAIAGLFLLPLWIGVIALCIVLAYSAMMNLLVDIARDGEYRNVQLERQTQILAQLANDMSDQKQKYELIDPDEQFKPERER